MLVGGVCLTLLATLGAAAPGAANPSGSSGEVSRRPDSSATANAEASSSKAKPRKRKWKAPRGPYFNDPHLKKGWFKIERRVISTINNTKKGSTIRIAIYSLDRVPVAQALVEAHKRGVKVQMLLNDHWENRAIKILRAEIGKNRNKKSFVYKCRASCRGGENEFNNLHSKFYLFSKAGKTKDLIAVGSANMTLNAARHQWNDLYFTAGDHRLFRQFVRLFNDMRVDYDKPQPTMTFCGTPVTGACDDSVDKSTVHVFPRRSGPKNDLVLDMLGRVQCITKDGSGKKQRTRLALNMHTMRGRRGDYLAAALRQKYVEGCDVRVSYGLIGFHTKGILGAPTRRGRIPLRSTGLDFNTEDNFDLNNDGIDDLILTYYTHQKYFIIQGTYNSVPDTSMVLTGSVNWSGLSPGNDEIWFTARGPKLAEKYLKNFNYQWRTPRNSRNAYTTSYSNFRVPLLVPAPDGTDRTVWRTERRPVTTIEPDGYSTGPYWEAD